LLHDESPAAVEAREAAFIVPTYARTQFHPRDGKGAQLIDAKGHIYWDLLGGIAVNVLGHRHPRLVKALREEFPGEVIVIWDNGPAHHGPALRAYLQTPDLHLRLIALPAYSPDYNPAEELWKWIREDGTANTCFGTGAKVAAAVWEFLLGLNTRLDEVKQRCQNELQTAAFPERARYPERRLRRLEQRRQRTVQAALAM